MKTTKMILAAALCIVLTACGDKKEQTEGGDALSVLTEKATLGSDYAATPYVGTVQAEGSTMVSFNGTGILKALTVSEGQYVRKGQLLATIDDSQSQNMLKAAKAALDQALDAEGRMKQLHETGSLPDIKWVEVQSNVQQARAAYDMAKKSVADCSVYATSSGVVDSKIMSVGENVLPTEPILTILNVNEVKVQVSVPEKEIARVQEGMASSITVDALDGETFVGGRIEKGISADPLTHTYNIYIHLPNPGMKLLPGMVASVRLDGAESAPALTVPVRAVQQSADKSLFVWVNDGGKAKRVSVTLGETVGNRVVISGGDLKEGQAVVTEGYQKLSEGTKVK